MVYFWTARIRQLGSLFIGDNFRTGAGDTKKDVLLGKEASTLGPDRTLGAYDEVVANGHHILVVGDDGYQILDATIANLLGSGNGIAEVQSLHKGVARGLHLGNIGGLVDLVLFGLGNLLGLVGLLVGEAIASPDGKGNVDAALGQSCVASLDVFIEIETANNDAGGSSLAPDLRMRTIPMTKRY